MATLADELAADLDFSSEEEEEQRSDIDEEQEALDRIKAEEGDEKMEESGDNQDDLEDNPNSVRRTCKLLYSKHTQDVLNVITLSSYFISIKKTNLFVIFLENRLLYRC